MTMTSRKTIRALFGASALVLSLAMGPAMADSAFTAPADNFAGRISAGSVTRGAAVYAGDEVVITGQGLIPGQQVNVMRGSVVLNGDTPLTVDVEGAFSLTTRLDDGAATGLQPLVVVAENPAAAVVAELKISPKVPLSGDDKFTVASETLTQGLYQVAYSDKSKALFVTSAVGRPPVKQSSLMKVDPETLKVVASVEPQAAPARPDGSDGGVFAVYGIATDDTNGLVWVSNTRQSTIAVYNQDDLSLVRQFDAGTVGHSRDIVVDEQRSRAYVSSSFTGDISVFDTKTLEQLEPIKISSERRGEEFGAMSLVLDEAAGKLYTVSLNTPEAAVVDLASGEVRVIALPRAKQASGVAYDAQDGLIFVASQNSDNLLIVKEETGETLHDVAIGAGALNLTFDPVSRLAYVSNRGAGTITVVDTEGQIVANLDSGSFPNHVQADGNGNIYAVNKSRGEDDTTGDRLWRIAPAN